MDSGVIFAPYPPSFTFPTLESFIVGSNNNKRANEKSGRGLEDVEGWKGMWVFTKPTLSI
jgi:hypothetical protein